MQVDDCYQRPKVMLVSDDLETARVWEFSLNQIGLDVVLVNGAEKTIQAFADEFPDLVIFEVFDTEVGVLELCQKLREESVVPILCLTSKPSETYFLNLYKAGVDDCIPSPISPRLFQAKITAWLRRIQSIPISALEEIKTGKFLLKPARRQLINSKNEVIRLSVLETRLLSLLMNKPDSTFDTVQLVERVWGCFGDANTLLLKNLIYRLRRKIEPDPGQPRYLLTDAKGGYRFSPGTCCTLMIDSV